MVILATTWYSGRVDLGVRYAKYEISRTLASRTRRTKPFVEDEGVAHRAALLSDKTWQSGEGGTKRQRAQLTSSNNLLCPSPVGRLRREDAMRSEIARCTWIYDRQTMHLSGISPLRPLAICLCHSSILCRVPRRAYQSGTIQTEAK